MLLTSTAGGNRHQTALQSKKKKKGRAGGPFKKSPTNQTLGRHFNVVDDVRPRKVTMVDGVDPPCMFMGRTGKQLCLMLLQVVTQFALPNRLRTVVRELF